MSAQTYPASIRSPGVVTSFNRTGSIGDVGQNNRMIVPGQVPPSCTMPLNTPYLPTGQTDVDNQTGAYSHLAHCYKAARSQPQAVGAEVWVLPVLDPSGGTVSTHVLTFLSQPTYDQTNGWIPGTATTLTQATTVDIEIGGFQTVSFRGNVGDTWAVIAQAYKTAAALVTDYPVVCSGSGAVITLTDRHAGAIGEQLWIRVRIYNSASGLAISPGTITVTGAAGADSTVVYGCGADLAVFTTPSVAIPNSTLAVAAALLIRAGINGQAFPVLAAVAAAGSVVTLYYVSDVFHGRLFETLTGAVTQTVVLAQGTIGGGNVSLTAAVAALQAGDLSFAAIAQTWDDTSTWTSIAAYVIAADAPGVERGQMAFGAITGGLLMQPSAALPQAASLTTSELFSVQWAQGWPVRTGEIAARTCALVASASRPATNFNNVAHRGNAGKPLPLPHRMYRPTDTGGGSQVELCIDSYNMAPLTVQRGLPTIRMALTTFASSGQAQLKLTKWSGALLPIFFRRDIRFTLSQKFMGGPDGGALSVKAVDKPQTAFSIDPAGVVAELYALAVRWGQLDYYDNVAGLLAAITAGINVSPTRIDAVMPFNGVADLDQIVVDGFEQG